MKKIGWCSDKDWEPLVIHPLLGRAKVDYSRRRTLFLPIPLNLAVVLWDKLYHAMRRGGDFKEAVWAAGYHKGFEDGLNDRRRNG